MIEPRAAVPVLLAALTLAACAHDGAGFPSLAPRATERVGFDEPAVAAARAPTADPALDAQLAPSAAQLTTLAAAFDGDASRARALGTAAGSRTVGSDAWIAAQTALAGLDDRRAQTASLTTDLDAMASERVAAAGEGYPALEALRDRAAAETERETTVIAALAAALPTP